MKKLNLRKQMNKESMRYVIINRGNDDTGEFAIAVFWLKHDAEIFRRKLEFGENEHYYIYDRITKQKINVEF